MSDHISVPNTILSKLRLICLDLPEAYEEQAWIGTRWCIKKKNFAHVLMLQNGYPPAYAKASGLDTVTCLLTFRFSPKKLDVSRFKQYPFFKPVWWEDIIGLVIDESVDWDEVEVLLKESYCQLAPKKLAEMVDGR
ncbi:MmcQ/YjbR family DNA-binding protein [Leptospira saintgironsiae]|uniref:MmcQ/YjbR family DNA-binding protein n=1 Tax=Leptospira saintgironsiae TaxID=2023183 RepID=A0A2M9YH18_9LEPT|nr:MmcQ/YjbR family DNA-binding protein [Leptospira saintgironsiae]PJZ50819.1 hypothetical protein CH362_03395 [Leptospira saintgironsiae]